MTGMQQPYSNPQGTTNTARPGDRREGRLCRIINVANGALLDVETGQDANFVIGSPESTAVIKAWRIVTMGSGYFIRPAGDTITPRYLSPTNDGLGCGKQMMLSTFPISWDLWGRTNEFQFNEEEFPPDTVEEWTCTICWAFHPKGPYVLELEENGMGTKVRMQPHRQPRARWQYWRIQYLDEVPIYTPMSDTPSPAIDNSSATTSKLDLESGCRYVLHNADSNTILDKAWRDNTGVNGWDSHGGDSQKWEVIDRGVGWVFRNVKNRGYLSINQEPQNGIKVVTTTSERTFWDIKREEFEESVGEGVYRVLLKKTDYSVSLANFGSSKNDTSIILWSSWLGRSQLWRFERVD